MCSIISRSVLLGMFDKCFRQKLYRKIKTHNLFFNITPSPSRISCRLWDNVEKHRTVGQAIDYNMALAHCTLYNKSYKLTLGICNACYSSTSTMVAWTRLNVRWAYILSSCPFSRSTLRMGVTLRQRFPISFVYQSQCVSLPVTIHPVIYTIQYLPLLSVLPFRESNSNTNRDDRKNDNLRHTTTSISEQSPKFQRILMPLYSGSKHPTIDNVWHILEEFVISVIQRIWRTYQRPWTKGTQSHGNRPLKTIPILVQVSFFFRNEWDAKKVTTEHPVWYYCLLYG